ncbi:fasciclin-like arabinogalactan protein 1 [Iris pallida]|uniref:Fasciclin-like arabinogalactan protein 1 n=1 Tax=Iris pallida TaxID=29817 RepID=A0AAX6HSM9_IRIPA|nr:fasciclin-like arabinogalactan protein 1 [Iris pallida]
MRPFLPFFFFLLLLSSSPILPSLGHSVQKHLLVQRRDLAGKAAKPAAEAPAPAAASTTPSTVDLIGVMSKKGCKMFADLLNAGAGDVAKTFEGAMSGGLTVFCPRDEAMRAFLPKFKNLTAEDKVSFLLYHGVPVYNSLDSLKTNNGVLNTLATDSRNYNFTVQDDGAAVTLQTDVTTATVRTTLVDREPVAVFAIDGVLEPRELFRAPAAAPAPEPAEAPAADAPEGAKKGKGKAKKKKHAASPPQPEGPDAAPADQKAADESGAGRWAASVVTVAAAAAALAVVA